jgi:hypothetical protein
MANSVSKTSVFDTSPLARVQERAPSRRRVRAMGTFAAHLEKTRDPA